MGDKSPVAKEGSGPSSPKEGTAAALPSKDVALTASSPREVSASAAPPTPGSPLASAPQEDEDSAALVTVAGILPAEHWIQAAEDEGVVPDDTASIAESVAASTESLRSTIFQYRKIHGRTFHSDVGNAAYWSANDEQQNESMDINHHTHTLLLHGKLFAAPLDTDQIQKVLDIGTGTGNWAIDFADDYPHVQVTGTDISPIQPGWIPPNLKFEIEDCTQEWTFEPESVDFVHMRLLVGSVSDWEALFAEAYRTLKPGGWIESYEGSPTVESEDGSVTEKSALGQWGRLFVHFGETIGRSFTVVADGMQRKAIEAAGFVDIQEEELKTPIGNWPKDPRLKDIGTFAQLSVEADVEGYVLYPATSLGWSREEVTVFAAHYRRDLRDPRTHPFYRHHVVWARKPLS